MNITILTISKISLTEIDISFYGGMLKMLYDKSNKFVKCVKI